MRSNETRAVGVMQWLGRSAKSARLAAICNIGEKRSMASKIKVVCMDDRPLTCLERAGVRKFSAGHAPEDAGF